MPKKKDTNLVVVDNSRPRGAHNLETAEALIGFYLERLAQTAQNELERDKPFNTFLVKTLATLVSSQKQISETYQRQEAMNYGHLSNAELEEALKAQLKELESKKALPEGE